MKKSGVFAFLLALACCAHASWYWPFGSDTEETDLPRVSELMEPVSLLIDEAADLAADGKVDESVEKYRQALTELDRIERENPERAAGVEFATLRNKRAYVNAAIDAMLLSQVKSNAKAVAISDTTELEKKLAAEKAKTEKKAEKKSEKKAEKKAEKQAKDDDEGGVKRPEPRRSAAKPRNKREAAMQAIANEDFPAAERVIGELLKEKPNSALALNLKATMEAKQGKLKEAEKTLDQAIMSNPRSPFAYYNMARLLLQLRPDEKSVAKRYYETGRAVGGAADEGLEERFR